MMRTLRKFLFALVLAGVLLRSLGTCLVLTSGQHHFSSETASHYAQMLGIDEVQTFDLKPTAKLPCREIGFKYIAAFVTSYEWEPLITSTDVPVESAPPSLYSVSLGIPSKPPCA